MLRGRFAPSPTGHLHLGNARTAFASWLDMRHRGGEWWLRIDDLDPDRSRASFTDAILRDLEWLGLTWDGPLLRQSERAAVYREAADKLRAQGLAFPCTCSRKDIARAASAPHGSEGPRYPGTCRSGARPGAPAALRFRVEEGPVRLVDRFAGPYELDLAVDGGDFVVMRADGVASYHLACVVDDALSGMTDILRGDDLLPSTLRHVVLQRALGLPTPSYAHIPLVIEASGTRMAKRDGAMTIAAIRERGVPAEAVIGLLAASLGLGDGTPVAAAEVKQRFSLEQLPRGPVTLAPP